MFNLKRTNEVFKMKKLAATLCIIGTAITLSACETTGSNEASAPYAAERTAGNAAQAEAPAERVFQERQMK
ncbi:MAG: hypothetical protein IT559_08045 [Alphaproteobacteria bacterium]|nr:hypothetical protein [Alphaproteobacteria bacterium]